LDTGGGKKWEFATDGYVVSSPVIGEDGLVYIGSFDGKVYALERDARSAGSFLPANHHFNAGSGCRRHLVGRVR
jgi:hypothetical protein